MYDIINIKHKKEEIKMEIDINSPGDEQTDSIEESSETEKLVDAPGKDEPPQKSVFIKIKEKLYAIGYENTIVRLLTAWIMIAGYELIKSDFSFDSFDFFNNINITVYIIIIAVIFAVLSAVNKPKLDKALLFLSTLIYGSVAVVANNKFYFSVGVCIFMGAVTVYCIGKNIKFQFRKIPTIVIVAVLGLAFTLFVGLLTTLNYIRFSSATYDFGIFSQMFTYMKETFLPYTTCERDMLMSHFAVHFSPIYYLLLPFFFIFPTPITLLMGQAAVIASGLIPLYLICKKYKFSYNAIILFSICYVLLPSMANGCFYYLHENKFLTAIILWLVYALEKDKWIPTIIFTFLLFAVKEDAPVYAAVLGLYFLVSKRNIKKSIVVFVISIIYFVIVSYFMSKYGLGIMDSRYDNFIYDGSGSLVTVIKAVILNPIYAIYESFDEEKIQFLLQMLVPLAFMPLMSKKPSRIVLFIPFILLNLMSDYPYQHDINFQYTYGSAAFLFYLMIMNYSDMKPGFRSKVLAVTAVSSVIMFMCNTYYRLDNIENYKADRDRGTIEIINDALKLVPKDASVVATTFMVPSLYDHKEVYDYGYTSHIDNVEYIVFDLRYGSDDYNLDNYINNPIYEIVTDQPGYIIIFRNTTVS